MISCDKAAELISAELDEALSSEEAVQLNEHLAQCAACRDLQADFQRLHQALLEAAAHWQAEPPEDLKRRVLKRIEREKPLSLQAGKRRWVRRGWGALAAVLVLAVIGGSAMNLWDGMGASGAGPAPEVLAPGGQNQKDADMATGGALPETAAYMAEAMPADEPAPQADGIAQDDTVSAEMGSGENNAPRACSTGTSELPVPRAAQCTALPEGILLVLLVDGVRYLWSEGNCFESQGGGSRKEADGRGSFTAVLPAGYEPVGAISSVTREEPEEELQLQAGFSTSGTVYASGQEPNVVYAYMDSPWFAGSYVRFDSEKLGNSRLIWFNASLYRFPAEGEAEDAPLEVLPEGCVSAGSLVFIGATRVPAGDLQTNCEWDNYGRSLDGRQVFQDPSDGGAVYVYEERNESEESSPAWRRCPLWEDGG